jgi:hypothetical protein
MPKPREAIDDIDLDALDPERRLAYLEACSPEELVELTLKRACWKDRVTWSQLATKLALTHQARPDPLPGFLATDHSSNFK